MAVCCYAVLCWVNHMMIRCRTTATLPDSLVPSADIFLVREERAEAAQLHMSPSVTTLKSGQASLAFI